MSVPKPVTCVYFKIYDNDTSDHAKRVNAIPFNSHDQASHWVNTIIEQHDHTWETPEQIRINGASQHMLISAHDLEDIVEHTPTTGVVINEPDISRLQRLVYFERTAAPAPVAPAAPKPAPTPAPTRKPKRKPSTDGTITVAQMADELNISAGKARNLLRKAKYKKPDNGWTFPIDSAEAKAVMSILSKGA